VLRAGLRSILSDEADFQIVGEAGDGHEALQKALELKPDVVIMDLFMPGVNGLETTGSNKGPTTRN